MPKKPRKVARSLGTNQPQPSPRTKPPNRAHKILTFGSGGTAGREDWEPRGDLRRRTPRAFLAAAGETEVDRGGCGGEEPGEPSPSAPLKRIAQESQVSSAPEH